MIYIVSTEVGYLLGPFTELSDALEAADLARECGVFAYIEALP